jgi:hypothetical protein
LSPNEFWVYQEDVFEASDLWFITRNKLLVEPGLPPRLATLVAVVAVQRKFHVEFDEEIAICCLSK